MYVYGPALLTLYLLSAWMKPYLDSTEIGIVLPVPRQLAGDNERLYAE